jgi:hypothetical protein
VPHVTPFPFIFHHLSNKGYIKFHLKVSMKLVLKMVFDGTAHYKEGMMKFLLMRMVCGIFGNVHIFTHPALSLQREVDIE